MMMEHVIPKETRAEILRRIRAAEKEHSVKILYAVESGSRAWGFASQNSDFDVRFIYAHPKDWYVAVDLEDKRDVIEYEIVDEIDINGWDVRKALRLFSKSNPSFVEWLQSPIVYVDDGHFAEQARSLLSRGYSVEKGIYHYRSMAKTNYRGYLQAEIVPLKKYFYVLRPLLSVRWLEEYREPPPIEFDRLRKLVPDGSELDREITALLKRKQASTEKELVPAIKALNDYVESEIERLSNLDLDKAMLRPDMSDLNELFHSVLGVA
ncbi:nucleotidyltransferase domain-containing protein [Porticoccus sp. W117]|uniref:nucleotidyltransferase domain-containing protein n=1 Tax=Porticoccus sp. W117 TaxID=3054777 RepID=UPI00259270AD|nr:nucleotidyltransferase domain-containing protein [Porticoccus sp. W117]MDM3871706.1 nucleotidyltransferase domain-containing protein [Porticoccus sp. W117]